MSNPCSKIFMLINCFLVAAEECTKTAVQRTVDWLGHWTKIMPDDLKLFWPRWGSFETPKLVYLHVQLEQKYRTSQKEWEAFKKKVV